MSNPHRYPYVFCAGHPNHPFEPGYGICPHVLNEGAAVAYFTAADEHTIGMIGCAECTPEKDPSAKNYTLTCAHSARQNGWAPQA